MKPSKKFPGGIYLETHAETLVAKQAHDEAMAIAGFGESTLTHTLALAKNVIDDLSPLQSEEAVFSMNIGVRQAALLLECLKTARRLSTDLLLVDAVGDMIDGYNAAPPNA